MPEKNELRLAARPDGYPAHAMPSATAISPTFGLLCEVDFRPVGNRIIFYYRNMGTFQVSVARPIETIVREIATGAWLPPDFPGTSGSPRKSSLSLHNRQQAYIVMMLNSTKEWQYSREAPCFTLFADPRIDLRSYYSKPTAVAPNGDVIGPIAGSSGSKLAFFIADGGRSNADQQGVNEDRFNIHVDFNEDAQKYTPVVIDPDVGYPGGTQP